MMTINRPTFKQACKLYPHRYTMEHIPEWAKEPLGKQYYAPQYRTDLEWYENTLFPGDRELPPQTKRCVSRNQTWPLGIWLNRPFTKTDAPPRADT